MSEFGICQNFELNTEGADKPLRRQLSLEQSKSTIASKAFGRSLSPLESDKNRHPKSLRSRFEGQWGSRSWATPANIKPEDSEFTKVMEEPSAFLISPTN